VGKFFRIMNKWAWPQPVLLKQIEEGPLQMKVWNPKVSKAHNVMRLIDLGLTGLCSLLSQIYHGDKFHLMPIITPAYPSMCATHNISMSTKTVILRELQRGGDVVDKIFTKQLSWSDLFTRHTFFTQDYKYYLSITASSKTKEDEAVWSGLVESKLRHLVGALDRKTIIAVAHPFPKGFERTHVITNAEEMEAVKNGSTKYQAKGTTTETTDETKDPAHEAAAQNGMENATVASPTEHPEQPDQKLEGESHTVYTTTYYIGLELKALEPGMFTNLACLSPDTSNMDVGTSRSLDISTDSKIFKSTCTSWAGYIPGIHDLAVTHVRR
jgi:poly(A) polymerase